MTFHFKPLQPDLRFNGVLAFVPGLNPTSSQSISQRFNLLHQPKPSGDTWTPRVETDSSQPVYTKRDTSAKKTPRFGEVPVTRWVV